MLPDMIYGPLDISFSLVALSHYTASRTTSLMQAYTLLSILMICFDA